jgi:NADP-dependent 3-hydroxy acid dehydrogenase YdfG
MAEHGRLDILVNNAGGAMPTPYLDTTPVALDEAFHFKRLGTLRAHQTGDALPT